MQQFLLLLVMVVVIAETFAFISPYPSVTKSRYGHPFNKATIAVFAKKSRGQGFGKPKEPSTPVIENSSSGDVTESTIATTTEMNPGTVKTTSQASNAEEIFKKYGIKDGDNQSKKAVTKKAVGDQATDAPFGESVLAGIPAPMQAKIEDILITLTFSSLTYLIVAGIGLSSGALKVVFPEFEIPSALDSITVNILTPSFAPALGIFLLFSVTFGTFKFAQISSNQTVYRE